jgi:hypothetical protein
MASLCSSSVVCVTCPYRLESPSGLAACMVSELSQQAEVTYVINLLVVKPKLTKILMNIDLAPLYVVRGRMIFI